MKFYKGQLVLVREWDDMVKEFGYRLGDETVIDCPNAFIENMKHLCGKVVRITNINETDSSCFEIEDDYWTFNEYMVTPLKPQVGDTVIIKSFEDIVEEVGEENVWYEGALGTGTKMVKVGNSNFRFDMNHLAGKECVVPEHADLVNNLKLDRWTIVPEMVYVINRPKQAVTLDSIEIGKLDSDEQPKIELANNPKEIFIVEGEVGFSTLTISGKEITIKFN